MVVVLVEESVVEELIPALVVVLVVTVVVHLTLTWWISRHLQLCSQQLYHLDPFSTRFWYIITNRYHRCPSVTHFRCWGPTIVTVSNSVDGSSKSHPASKSCKSGTTKVNDVAIGAAVVAARSSCSEGTFFSQVVIKAESFPSLLDGEVSPPIRFKVGSFPDSCGQ